MTTPETPAGPPGTPAGTPEHEALLHALRFARDRVLGAVEGLDDDTMRRAVLPSGWTPVGLLSHLTHDVERFWFGAVTAGEDEVVAAVATGLDGWRLGSDLDPADAVAAYVAAGERSDAILAATPADSPPAWWPDFFGPWRLATVRDVVLHVIVETACHAGHLDAARELVDGRQWMVQR